MSAATRYAGDTAVSQTIALAERFPQVYRDACHAIDRQADATPDPSETASVARLGIGAHFTGLLAADADDLPTWTADADERKAYTWTVARTITARVAAAQRAEQREALSLDALAEDGAAYDLTTDQADDIARTDPARPDACTRQTAADTIGGIAARVAETPEGSPERTALEIVSRAEQARADWTPADPTKPYRRPTAIGALCLALSIAPKSAQYQAARKHYAAAVALLAPLARDAYRDAWHVGTRSTNERERGWTTDAAALADLLAAEDTYRLAYGAHAETNPRPTLAVVWTTDDQGRRFAAVAADRTEVAWGRDADETPEAFQARGSAWLAAEDTTTPLSPYADRAAAQEARRAEKSPHAGLDRAPAVDRTQESKSHKAPSPRKRKSGGQTGPTVPARLSR